MDKARKIGLIIVILCFLGAGALLFCRYYFAPEKVAERTFEALARDYYENYYYENFFAKMEKSEIEKYVEHGAEPVYLKELLNHTDRKDESAFSRTNYQCDTNKSSVKYFPEGDFGREDYHVEYNLVCDTEL